MVAGSPDKRAGLKERERSIEHYAEIFEYAGGAT